MIPAGLRGWGLPSLDRFDSPDAASSVGEYHLHPHYRMPRPLDPLLLKTQAGLDSFVTEKYADEIAAILSQWTSGLLQSPQDLRAFEAVLAANFSGASPIPAESRVLRPGPAIEVRRNTFHRDSKRARDAFLQEFRSALGNLSKIVTALPSVR